MIAEIAAFTRHLLKFDRHNAIGADMSRVQPMSVGTRERM